MTFGKAAVLLLPAVLAISLLRANRPPAVQGGAGTPSRPSAAPDTTPGPDPAPATAARADPSPAVLDLAPYARWETFTRRDGLPSDRVFAVRIDGERVWAGTTEGLALYEKGRWRAYGTADGLPHRVVLALDVSPRTGDLWIGTMGGLARLSGGRIDAFTQTGSGLSNDFVNGVRCDPDEDSVWAATAMGASRLDLRTGEWTIFTHENAPMHEPWTYSVAMAPGTVYIGAWGTGILEFTKATGRWREYRDPDGQMEVDLLPDDGPVHDVTAGVDFAGGFLWQATYFGLARYDGREWRSYFAQDSGLASDFINFVRARGRHAWLATDRGLSLTDGEGWVTYRRLEDGRGEILFFRGGRRIARRLSPTAPAHNYVLGVDASGDEVWVATEKGVSRGVRSGPAWSTPLARTEQAGPPAAAMSRNGTGAEGRFHYASVPDALLPYRGHVPYRDFFVERPQFRGAGREEPAPEGLQEVRLGFIGPLAGGDLPSPPSGPRPAVRYDPKAVFGRWMLRGATLAIEEANTAGGYRGVPFRLVPRTDLVLWGQSSNELVRFALEDRVWAVLSSIDSNHNHVLSRATLKLEVPIVSAGSTDPTLVEHAIPWLVRSIHDDRQNAFALLNEIFVMRGLRRAALLRVNDRDGRVGVMEFVEGARRLGHPIVIEQRFNNGDTDFRPLLERIRETSPDALVLWGNPREAGLAVRQAREMGMRADIFGFDRLGQASFLEAAGEAAEGVVIAASLNPDSEEAAWLRFKKSYRERWGEDPETFAAHAYDGMALLIEGVRKGGLNRARIRDALFDLRTHRGATGTMVFDTNMSDVGTVWLGTVKGGRFHYRAAPKWAERGRLTRTGAEAPREGG